MAQWGNTDDAANSVLWGVSNYNKVANTANKTAFFGNTTVVCRKPATSMLSPTIIFFATAIPP